MNYARLSYMYVACQNGSVPEWLSRSSRPGNKRGVIVAFSAPLGTIMHDIRQLAVCA